MKLAIVSDLHLEGYRVEKQHEIMETIFDDDYSDCVAIFAGDIMTGYQAPEFLDQYRSRFRDLIYIPGNHDLWYSDIDRIGTHPLDLAGGAAHYDDVVIICEVGFPYHPNRNDPFDHINWLNGLFESDHITDHGKKFMWDRWQDLAYDNFWAISSTLEAVKSNFRKTVVVTHYPPSGLCNNPNFAHSDMTPLFVSGLEYWLTSVSYTPDLWISGHTHWRWDETLGDTRLVGNCFGYMGELQSSWIGYKPMIIEV